MKNIFKIILLIAILYMPFVYADVSNSYTYFIKYPDGEEFVVNTEEEANAYEEKLILSGTTDKDGKLLLCDITERTGKLRIVEHVPDGYTTNTKEIIYDLSSGGEITFTNYRGIVNPTTGRTLLFIIVVIGVIGITMASKKNKNNLIIVPIILLSICAFVHAEDVCPCVKVKDALGNPIQGVDIDVYAEPIVEAAPAIILDANGGKFFDGKELMYVKLPSSSCDKSTLIDSLSVDLYQYYYQNSVGAYRNGYRPLGFNWLGAEVFYHNGDVIKMEWEEDNTAIVGVIDGNGGYYDFYGEKLTSVTVYSSDYINELYKEFINDGKFYIGNSIKKSCSNYNEYGLLSELNINGDIDNITYLCWAERPDGIYINENLFFQGNKTSCFNQSYLNSDPDNIRFYSPIKDTVYVFKILFDDQNDYLLQLDTQSTNYGRIDMNWADSITGDTRFRNINHIKIIEKGEVLLDITDDDLEKDGSNYIITNNSKKSKIATLIDDLNDSNCLGPYF